jgi:hypothetical protein
VSPKSKFKFVRYFPPAFIQASSLAEPTEVMVMGRRAVTGMPRSARKALEMQQRNRLPESRRAAQWVPLTVTGRYLWKGSFGRRLMARTGLRAATAIGSMAATGAAGAPESTPAPVPSAGAFGGSGDGV